MLGPYMTKLADRLHEKNVHKEEAVEVLCRATNAAMEDGKMGFKDEKARAVQLCVYVAHDNNPRVYYTVRPYYVRLHTGNADR